MSWHLASRSCMTMEVSGPIRKDRSPSGEIRPGRRHRSPGGSKAQTEMEERLPLLELLEHGSYLSIKALIWSCRRRGNSSSLSRESLCFSLRNLVKFSLVIVGLLELKEARRVGVGGSKQTQMQHRMLLRHKMTHYLPHELANE